MSDNESQGSDVSSADGVMRFWGASVSAKTPVPFVLTSTELRVSQACLGSDSKAGSYAVLLVKCGIVDEPVAVCSLRHGGTEHAALNLEFFAGDGAVEFSVKGNATIDLTGWCCGPFGRLRGGATVH